MIATRAQGDALPPAPTAMVVCYSPTLELMRRPEPLLDLRWQMVLNCLVHEPVFSQGARSISRALDRADLDRRLLERSRELAYQTKAFDPKKLPKTLRVAMDSSPLEGAGRVEDTINLARGVARSLHVPRAAGLTTSVCVARPTARCCSRRVSRPDSTSIGVIQTKRLRRYRPS
jgi:hypothetical protein